MKKQRRQLLLLLLVLLALAGGYFGLDYYNKNIPEQEEIKEYVVEIAEDSIQRISYIYEEKEYAFVKEEELWKYEDDTTVNIIQTSIDTMENRGENLTYMDKIENVTDFSQYGLENPSRYFSFETTENVHTFYVGDYNSFSYGYYICEPDSDTVYLVGSTVITAFQRHLEDLIEEENTESIESTESAEKE